MNAGFFSGRPPDSDQYPARVSNFAPMETPTIPVVLYAESTPNPATMKFVANRMLIDDGATAQYLSPEETAGSPLAAKLFRFPFVKGVFVSANYVTVTKSDSLTWDDITLELREFIRDHIAKGLDVVTEIPKQEVHTDNSFKSTTTVFTEH